MYIFQSEYRKTLLNHLKEWISTGVYYPVHLQLQKVYKELGYKEGDIPNAEYLSFRTFAIPIYADPVVAKIYNRGNNGFQIKGDMAN